MAANDRVAKHRVAALQLCSGDNVAANLETCDRLLAEAAQVGCTLAFLPENFAFFGRQDQDKLAIAEVEGSGPIQGFLSETAKRYGMALIAGSLPLVGDEGRCYGASMLFDANGAQRAVYRKMHLFDVDIATRGERYRESAYCTPGDDVVTVPHAAGVVGLSICYDLRFPELYRQMAAAGASLFSIPAAFTETTGKAHWEILLRARAVENLAWVIAAAQYGQHPNGRRTWGHSMIIDPWGRIVATQESGDGIIVADLDVELTDRLRRDFPVLNHRRL
ncbi:MAG: carbon-nitrogen hydrolase family protein [Woeseia sp.]